jgi:hypothetical protein
VADSSEGEDGLLDTGECADKCRNTTGCKGIYKCKKQEPGSAEGVLIWECQLFDGDFDLDPSETLNHDKDCQYFYDVAHVYLAPMWAMR